MNIVFDIDDTLTNLFVTTLKLANIPVEKAEQCKCFNLRKDDLWGEGEVMVLNELWEKPSTFLLVDLYPGIERINDLINSGHNVTFHSYCTNEKVAVAKRTRIQKAVIIPDDKFIMQVRNKTPLIEIEPDIIIEDNIDYLLKCSAKVSRILIARSFNSEQATGLNYTDLNITRVQNLNGALDKIAELLANKEEGVDSGAGRKCGARRASQKCRAGQANGKPRVH